MGETVNPIERFAKLEKLTPPEDDRGKFVQDLTEVKGDESIIISATKAGFYDLLERFEEKNVKIFQTEDWKFWVVEFQ